MTRYYVLRTALWPIHFCIEIRSPYRIGTYRQSLTWNNCEVFLVVHFSDTSSRDAEVRSKVNPGSCLFMIRDDRRTKCRAITRVKVNSNALCLWSLVIFSKFSFSIQKFGKRIWLRTIMENMR